MATTTKLKYDKIIKQVENARFLVGFISSGGRIKKEFTEIICRT